MRNYLKNEIVEVIQIWNSSRRLFGLAAVLLIPSTTLAQDSNVLAKADTTQNSSLFVVSDEELKTYSNTADLIRELKVLKKDKESLLDYSKKLREKFKDLEEYYAKENLTHGEGLVANNFAPDLLAKKQVELEAATKDRDKISQEIQNLKTEYDAVKLQYSSLKDEYSKYKAETELKIGELEVSKDTNSSDAQALKIKVEELTNEISNKEIDSKACFEQLDQSQNMVGQIPEYERKIVELKNELLMKKSAAELFGLDSSDDSKKNRVESKNVASIDKSRSNRAKRLAIAKEEEINSAVAKEIVKEIAPPLNSDMMIIEVTGDKVALRAGPGADNSTIMDIGRGAKLTVEARDKDWYRVNSPTGGRAYIHKDYVRVIDNGKRQEVKSEALAKSNISDFKEGFVSMEVEPVKPPLPGKPIKRIGADKVSSSKSIDGLSMSQESIALQALKNAMNNNSKELENSSE